MIVDSDGPVRFLCLFQPDIGRGRISKSNEQAIDGVNTGRGKPAQEKIVNHGHAEVYRVNKFGTKTDS